VVAPGLVHLHTHLREPGREDAETVESGARAAAVGGYTAVCAMPNTDPVADTAAVILEVRNLAVAIKNIARACGDEISDRQPILDARLEDGSRVAAMLPW
jgi:dihydroorotase-like cyclic amidohydrolase